MVCSRLVNTSTNAGRPSTMVNAPAWSFGADTGQPETVTASLASRQMRALSVAVEPHRAVLGDDRVADRTTGRDGRGRVAETNDRAGVAVDRVRTADDLDAKRGARPPAAGPVQPGDCDALSNSVIRFRPTT